MDMASQPISSRPKVISLIRVSSDEQGKEDRYGIPRQIESNRIGMRNHGLDLAYEEIVIDVSGPDVMRSEQFQKIFRDLSRPDICGVIVSEQSRLVRPLEWEQYGVLDHFKRNGKCLYTTTDRLDPNTQSGRISLTINGMMAGNELVEIIKRLNDAKEAARKLGIHCGPASAVPRGLKFCKTRDPITGKATKTWWEYDTLEAARIKRAYELLLADRSYVEIAEEIGGWKSKGRGLARSLKNPVWKGYREYKLRNAGEKYQPSFRDGTPRLKKDGTPVKFRRKTVRRDEPLLVKLDIEPLISEEMWDRAQAIMAKRGPAHRMRYEQKPGGYQFLAAGLGKCSCGRALYGRRAQNKSGNISRYICASHTKENKERWGAPCPSRTYQARILDGAVEQMVREYLSDAELIGKLVGRATDAQKKADPAKAKRDARLAQIEKERKNAQSMTQQGLMSFDECREALRLLDVEAKQLQKLVPMETARASAKAVLESIARVFVGFDNLTFERKRELLERAVSEIRVEDGAITSITFIGGFIGNLNRANFAPASKQQSEASPTSNVLIPFPKPIKLQSVPRGRPPGKGRATAA